MQKALAIQHQAENHCFADDAVDDAEETDTLLSSVSIEGRPLCNMRFATDIDLLGGSEEELSRDKASNTMEKAMSLVQIINSTTHLSCQYCSMDVRAGSIRTANPDF